jgi:hypothetical protein
MRKKGMDSRKSSNADFIVSLYELQTCHGPCQVRLVIQPFPEPSPIHTEFALLISSAAHNTDIIDSVHRICNCHWLVERRTLLMTKDGREVTPRPASGRQDRANHVSRG